MNFPKNKSLRLSRNRNKLRTKDVDDKITYFSNYLKIFKDTDN